jgi:hypothetical protein
MKVFNLNFFVSPTIETSFYKGIPIEYLDITRKILKANGHTCKIRYRGPRRDLMRANCLKKDAVTFAVYQG